MAARVSHITIIPQSLARESPCDSASPPVAGCSQSAARACVGEAAQRLLTKWVSLASKSFFIVGRSTKPAEMGIHQGAHQISWDFWMVQSTDMGIATCNNELGDLGISEIGDETGSQRSTRCFHDSLWSQVWSGPACTTWGSKMRPLLRCRWQGEADLGVSINGRYPWVPQNG